MTDRHVREWLRFRDYKGRVLVYFTMSSQHAAVERIDYSFDDESLDRSVACRPVDPEADLDDGVVEIIETACEPVESEQSDSPQL